MSGVAAVGYVMVMAAAYALTASVTPAARHLASRMSLVDRPSARKLQASPVPLLGGMAMALGFSLVLIASLLLIDEPDTRRQIVATVGLAVVVLLLGLVDDLRGLAPWTRLAAEIVVGAAAWAAGLGVSLSGVPLVDLTLTVAWVAVVTNAFNLLDNMDGLSAGVASIAALWFLVIAGVNGQFLVATMAAAVGGCALGFLRYNLPPARIYMGDAGALFVGFCLSIVAMKLRFDGPTRVTFFVPILVLGVPLLDTALVVLTRVRAGLSPFQGGRDHLSHRLVALGASPAAAVTGLWALGLGFGWTALVMSRVDTGTAFVLMALVLTLSSGAGALLVVASAQRERPRPVPPEPAVLPGDGGGP